MEERRITGQADNQDTQNDVQKKLLQAKHRMEEAQARDRLKERKARTRRLIQEGAILEKVYPAAAGMELAELETELCRKFH